MQLFFLLVLASFISLASLAAQAQTIKLSLGMSGWTGFAPLTLAQQSGIFKAHGLDVEIKKIPQKDRHMALAADAIQCVATTVETYVAWNANGVPVVQILQLDKSYGADGLAVRHSIRSFADLKGRTIAVDAPGTASYFGLAYMLQKNGMTLKDVKLVTLSPQIAAQAFVAGQNDAAMTYEPYLTAIRQAPEQGQILATTLDYPMVMDTLGCSPQWLQNNPKAAKALVESYFSALDMIKRSPQESYAIMGAAVKQTGAQFAESAGFLRWTNREDNQRFFAGELASFSATAADLLLNMGLIRKLPDMSRLYDDRFIQ